MSLPRTAERVLADLTPGSRTKSLFDTARSAVSIGPDELELLLSQPSYEARLCLQHPRLPGPRAARRPGTPGLRDTYLRHHDRFDDWGTVDRAASRVIGATLTGGPHDLLQRLATSPDPQRRRTAMTAPLWFVKHGDHGDVVAGIAIAEVLHADVDPWCTSQSASTWRTPANGCLRS